MKSSMPSVAYNGSRVAARPTLPWKKLSLFSNRLFFTCRCKDELKIRDGFALVTFSWVAFALVGALPFYFSGYMKKPIDQAVIELKTSTEELRTASQQQLTSQHMMLL